MALEHAILVSLSERAGSGLELTHRFDRSIGFFWSATHQQIYRVLGRMEAAGWVRCTVVAQQGRPDKKDYAVTAAGRRELERWLAEPLPIDEFRSDLAVRLRGASYGDRTQLLERLVALRAEHHTRLAHYEQLVAKDYPDPDRLTGADLDRYLVLRGGVLVEQFWGTWLDEYVAGHERASDTGTTDRTTDRTTTGGAEK